MRAAAAVVARVTCDMSASAEPGKPPAAEPGPREVDADSVVRQLGQAGRFHLRVYVLVALVAVQVGLLHTTYIFLAARVPYRWACSSSANLYL